MRMPELLGHRLARLLEEVADQADRARHDAEAAFTIFQSRPSSQARAPIAPVAFRVMFFSLAIASMSWQYLP